MNRSPLVRRTPLKSGPSARKERGPGLAQRIANAVGTAFRHEPKGPTVFRSRKHRQNVAALACVCCTRSGPTQAAHLNLLAFGKGKSLKVSDALLVPLCPDRLGQVGCHYALDQSGVYDKATSATLQLKWLHETRDQLRALGQWPAEAEADVARFVGAYLARCT